MPSRKIGWENCFSYSSFIIEFCSWKRLWTIFKNYYQNLIFDNCFWMLPNRPLLSFFYWMYHPLMKDVPLDVMGLLYTCSQLHMDGTTLGWWNCSLSFDEIKYHDNHHANFLNQNHQTLIVNSLNLWYCSDMLGYSRLHFHVLQDPIHIMHCILFSLWLFIYFFCIFFLSESGTCSPWQREKRLFLGWNIFRGVWATIICS